MKLRNTQRESRLAAYSTMAIAIAATTTTQAQIVYTDIDPDISFSTTMGEFLNEIMTFDFDENGTDDLTLVLRCRSVTMTDYQEFYLFAYTGSVITDYFVSALNEGDLISDDNNFENFGLTMAQIIQYSGFSYYSGDWVNAENKYLGFRIPTGGNYMYGWMRLTYKVDFPGVPFLLDEFSVKDYAFNTTPCESIIAGEGIPDCIAPALLPAFGITASAAKTKWDEIPDADTYQLFYRAVGAGTWHKKSTAINQKKLTGLNCDTEYEWKVRAKCGMTTTPFSEIQTFTTASCKMAGEESTGIMSAFPNPAAELITLEIIAPQNDYEIIMTDLLGNIIQNYSYSIDEDLVEFDISQLSAGMYVISFLNAGTKSSISFVKQ